MDRLQAMQVFMRVVETNNFIRNLFFYITEYLKRFKAI
jgi:hypothetical protein